MTKSLFRLSWLLIAICLFGCSPERTRVVHGPASVVIGGTMYTPTVAVTIEENGWLWFGHGHVPESIKQPPLSMTVTDDPAPAPAPLDPVTPPTP